MQINPMAHIINAYRAIFYYHQSPDWKSLAIMFAVSIVIIVLGYVIFEKLQKRFAEEL